MDEKLPAPIQHIPHPVVSLFTRQFAFKEDEVNYTIRSPLSKNRMINYLILAGLAFFDWKVNMNDFCSLIEMHSKE
jgi:hypothetical protein